MQKFRSFELKNRKTLCIVQFLCQLRKARFHFMVIQDTTNLHCGISISHFSFSNISLLIIHINFINSCSNYKVCVVVKCNVKLFFKNNIIYTYRLLLSIYIQLKNISREILIKISRHSAAKSHRYNNNKFEQIIISKTNTFLISSIFHMFKHQILQNSFIA